MFDKALLRKEMLAKRDSLDEGRVEELSGKIQNNLLNQLLPKIIKQHEASVLALYQPIRNEVRTNLIAEFCLDKNITFCYPKLLAKNSPLVFVKAHKNSTWQKSFIIPHIVEIEGSTEVTPQIIIVPLAAFDKELNRIGYGGGFYDRTIHSIKNRQNIITIGLAYEFQFSDLITYYKHDMRLDFVVTENVIRCAN